MSAFIFIQMLINHDKLQKSMLHDLQVCLVIKSLK